MWIPSRSNGSHVFFSLALLLIGTVSLVSSFTPNRDTRSPLTVGIDEILNSDNNKNAFWGVYVRSVTSGEIVYEHNADNLLIPASNQKLLTTATALSVLGSSFQYETPLIFSGERSGDVLKGDLVIVGSGDPTFGERDEEKGVIDPFEQWANTLFDSGIRRIEGRIIGDDDIFDDQQYGDGWDVSLVSTNAYAAPVSGLSYRSNSVKVRVEGYKPGASPRLLPEPAGYIDIENQVSTHGRRRGQRIDVIRPLGQESVQLKGSVSQRFRGTVQIPVANPTKFAVVAFKDQLTRRGITVNADVFDIDDLPERPKYRTVDTLAQTISEPLSKILPRINKESNNQYAEQVFRTFGWGGSAIGGERRTKQLFDDAQIGRSGLSVRDGSGLSRKDLVSARMLGDLLVYMHGHPEAETFINSLAASGEEESTLEHRLTKLQIRAKTGSLEYSRSLSGYVVGVDGDLYAFTILSNNYATSSTGIRRSIDSIVGVLANSTIE